MNSCPSSVPVLALSLMLVSFARAGDASEPAPASSSVVPPTIWTQDTLTGDWGGTRDRLKKDGVTFTPSWIGEVFGNPSGGAKQGTISDGYFNLPLDADLDPLTHGALKDTTFHVNAFYLYGASLSSGFVGDFSNTSNAAGYNTIRLDELWAQKLFWSQKLSLKVGNMDISNEFFRSNSAALFINNTFGAFTLIGNNIPDLPVFPLASPGVRIQVSPDPRFYAMAGVFGLDNNAFQNTNDKYGTLFAMNADSGMLVMSEVGFLLDQQPDDKGLPGTYRLGSFVDTDNFATYGSQAALANGTGPLRSAGPDWGIYGVVDQQIYVEDARNISVFTRCGGTSSDIDFVDYYVDGGFNFTGFIPGRDNDVAGLAIARSRVSPAYSDAQVAEGNPSLTAETVIEATYRVQISPWWTVQPDFQYYVTPSGMEGSHNAVVLGCRTSIQF